MDLVHNDHLKAISGWTKRKGFLKTAHIFNAVVGCAIDLQYIQVRADGDLFAGITLIAWVSGGALYAIERLGNQAPVNRNAWATLLFSMALLNVSATWS